MGVNVYLAARYSRREELNWYKRDLEQRGHKVTSRWLLGGHQISDAALQDDHGDQGFEASERQRFAQEDWEDLVAADVVISFTETPRSSSSRGGRHVEFGAALALGKACIVVGPRENVFHCLPQVTVVDSWYEILEPAEKLRRGAA